MFGGLAAGVSIVGVETQFYNMAVEITTYVSYKLPYRGQCLIAVGNVQAFKRLGEYLCRVGSFA